MTTNVTIRTDGDYVSEGKIEVWIKRQLSRTEEIKIGPGSTIEKSWPIPRGATAMLYVTERQATPLEVANKTTESVAPK